MKAHAIAPALLAALASPVAWPQAAHDALQPAGPQAAHIASLWWLAVAICAVVFVAILAALAWALWRAPRAQASTPPEISPPPAAERRHARGVAIALGVCIVLLVVILVGSISTDRALASLPLQDAVHIDLTGHQWWWEATYDDPQPDRIFHTANELHVPVGRPVIVTLHSDDVIHSFWVPSLDGKKDLIPGRTAQIEFRADRPGDYRGQCAEYCGLQHAFMALDVIAMPPGEYAAWAEAQRRPAADPADPQARRGRDLFLSGTCMMCHAILGTTASARSAPDLTHVASRARIAAGRLANTPENLAAWIHDPQAIKPGANMPANLLAPDDLHAVVAYLETLR